MVYCQSSNTLVAPAIAMSVVNVAPGQFDSLTFSVSSDNTGLKPEVRRSQKMVDLCRLGYFSCVVLLACGKRDKIKEAQSVKFG